MNILKSKKLIAMDLDGTLLDMNKKISDKTKSYLKRLKAKGYIIVIATGRILNNAIDVTDGAEFANYVVSDAGGLIYDMQNNEILAKKVISKETISKICSRYNDDIEYIEMCDLNYYHKYTDKNYPESNFSKIIKDIDSFIKNTDVIHISINMNNNLEKMYNYLTTNFNDIESYFMQDSFSDNKWIDISVKKVNKYEAIKIISERENIANNDIIAFGDSPNDLEMLKYCGIGVAIGNALNSVKEVANYVTKTNNEDGIMYFLEEYLKDNE